MAAEATYRLMTLDADGSVYEGPVLHSALEAAEAIATEHFMHSLTRWDIERCSCGLGFLASKDGKTRAYHIEIVDEDTDLVALALSIGVLHPASVKDGLEVA